MILLGLAMILFFGYFTWRHHGLGSVPAGGELGPDVCRPRGDTTLDGGVFVDCPECRSPRDGIWPLYSYEWIDGQLVGSIIRRSITCGPCLSRMDASNCSEC